MKRSMIVVSVIVLMMALVAGSAFAASPKINKANASINSQGTLVVAFQITGLGSNENLDVTLSTGGGTVEWTCTNRGSKNKVVVPHSGSVAAAAVTEPFSSAKNGTIKGSISIPVPSGVASCTGGHVFTLVDVTWNDVLLDAGVAGTRSFGTVSLN